MTAPTRGPQLTYGYIGPIVKHEMLDDGTCYVYGKAAGPDLDLDGQRMDPTWLKTAMPKWFEWGNIREQHSNIAAGVGVELTEDGDDWYVKAHIVDPSTVKKVVNKVLKGFSGGIVNGRVIRSKSAPNGLINDGEFAELSLVDRPANATCMVDIAKSADGVTFYPIHAGGPDDDAGHGDAPVILGDPISEPTAPEVIEKTAGWHHDARRYRDALRAVEDALAGRYGSTVPFITKAAQAVADDERADVAGAHAAIDLIADLIISEAQGLKGGNLHEVRDIEVLTQAADSLTCFIGSEQDEDEPGLSDEDVYDGDDADKAYMIKAAGTPSLFDELWEDEPVRPRRIVKRRSTAGDEQDGDATVIDVNAEITKAVAAARQEFSAAHEAEIATLRRDLEKALAAPLAGGPVTFAVPKTSAAPSQPSAESEADKAAALAQDPRLSPEVRHAYLAKAASLRKGASI